MVSSITWERGLRKITTAVSLLGMLPALTIVALSFPD